MRIAWLTDPHFNHVATATWDRLLEQLAGASPDCLMITGDISEGEDVEYQLGRLSASFSGPIYFVLGNHDFYGDSIARTRRRIVNACASQPRLVYLTNCFDVPLSPEVGLVGDDGWGDATVGDYEGSPVRLADFQAIDDFRDGAVDQWKVQLQQYGLEAADRLRPKLEEALDRFKTVIVATHVPPFREACWYEGHTTDDLWAPFFVCGSVGEVLREAAANFAHRQLIVLCGHTHHSGSADVTGNLTVLTGHSECGQPRLSATLAIEANTCHWRWC